MEALHLVNLHKLMSLSEGNSNIIIGLIDGPVDPNHPNLNQNNIRHISSSVASSCRHLRDTACGHGTAVASILLAKRGGIAPAICPGCTLIVRTIFLDNPNNPEHIPTATFAELAAAIIDCIEAGAHIINISAAPSELSSIAKQDLEDALDYACQRGVLVIVSAGNQGLLGASIVTRHHWVISVAACDNQGTPINNSNLGASNALNGLSAPGLDLPTLAPGSQANFLSGTSAAAPLVTGASALLWSIYPTAQARTIRLALVPILGRKRRSVVPRLLNAWEAYKNLNSSENLHVS